MEVRGGTGATRYPPRSAEGSFLVHLHTGNAPRRKFSSDRVSNPVSLLLDGGLSDLRLPLSKFCN